MIDWLTMVAPLPHREPIADGHVLSLDADGSVQWQSTKALRVVGSFSAGLQVRTVPRTLDPCTHIEVSGNPVKFFQGHNLWGSDDLPSLAVATLEHIATMLNIEVSSDTRELWCAGDVQLKRVDIAGSFHLGSLGEVLAWIRAAEQTAHLAYRGRGTLVKGSTLYFGKNFRDSLLKLYPKGQEIRAKGHGQEAVLELSSAVAWAERTLRAELVVRSMGLKRRGLGYVRDWLSCDGVPLGVTPELLRNCLSNMTMTSTAHLSAEQLSALRPALRAAVVAWEAGNDLRSIYARATFYKYRSELLPLGIDIATLCPREVSNVVPLYKVLEAVPAGVPDWAVGTPLFFEPRRIA